MKRDQLSQALFGLAGAAKPKTSVRDNKYHDGSYQVSFSDSVLAFKKVQEKTLYCK